MNVVGIVVVMGMVSNGVISIINNWGNLGDVVKDVIFSDVLRGYVVVGMIVGLIVGVYDKWILI